MGQSFHQILEEELGKYKKSSKLTKEDMDILLELGKFSGYQDIVMQERMLEISLDAWRNQITKVRSEVLDI